MQSLRMYVTKFRLHTAMRSTGKVIVRVAFPDPRFVWWSNYCLFFETLHREVCNNSGNRASKGCAFLLFVNWSVKLKVCGSLRSRRSSEGSWSEQVLASSDPQGWGRSPVSVELPLQRRRWERWQTATLRRRTPWSRCLGYFHCWWWISGLNCSLWNPCYLLKKTRC